MISKRPLLALGLTLALAGASAATAQNATPPPEQGSGSTVDHSKLDALQKDFATGPDVTAACLSCHTEASDQVKQSIHWDWDYEHPETGQDLGKNNVINSYCVGVAANEPRCTSCHVGYGWTDMATPPPMEANAVDCLVCHDKSDTYFKVPAGAGKPFGKEVKEGREDQYRQSRKTGRSETQAVAERRHAGSRQLRQLPFLWRRRRQRETRRPVFGAAQSR